MTTLVAPQNLNAINHMRRTEGGAFPLPSEADISLLLLPHIRGCDILRQAAMKHHLDHCDLIPRARPTNRLLDCGIRADRSSIDLSIRKPAMVPAAPAKSEALTVASGH